MAQPLDRNCRLSQRGALDRAAGEFWFENPFLMLQEDVNLSAFERNRMFLNLDGRSFLDVSFASGVDLDSDSRSAIAADFNRDGAVDLLVGSVGGGRLRLFYNRLPRTNHRAQIKLVGVTSNRSAIGARVVAHCGPLRVIRDLFPANGFQGLGPAQLWVGMGEHPRIDRLLVRWPSGKEQEFLDLPGDCRIVITEGKTSFDAESWAPSK